MLSMITMCLMANAACGYSPLLNHTYPVRVSEDAGIQAEQNISCRMEFQNHTLCADYVWVKEPRGSDEGAMKVYFWQKNQPGTYESPEFSVGVKLWMPDMGHGSQKVKVSPAKDSSGQILNGVYDATEVMFVMGGDWEIQFQLKDAAGKVVEMQKLPYSAQ